MVSGCITSHDTCKCVKSHTHEYSGKGFAQVLSHYGWQIPRECKVQAWHQFYQSTPRWKWDVRVPSIESVELQGIESTYGHHLLHRGEGLVVLIKYR